MSLKNILLVITAVFTIVSVTAGVTLVIYRFLNGEWMFKHQIEYECGPSFE